MPTAPGLYSRVVAILKLGLPLIALGMLAALFLIQTDDGRNGGNLIFSDADLAALGTGLRVNNPIFTGTTSSGDAFRFTAALVVPDAAPPTRAAITDLEGRLDLQGGGSVELTAATGDLDISAQRLALAGNDAADVTIVSSDGYRIEAETVRLDLAAGVLDAERQVRSVGPLGSIASDTLRIAPSAEDAGDHSFSFGGGVRVLYQPPKPAGGATAP